MILVLQIQVVLVSDQNVKDCLECVLSGCGLLVVSLGHIGNFDIS
jgi:hypothetical protein